MDGEDLESMYHQIVRGVAKENSRFVTDDESSATWDRIAKEVATMRQSGVAQFGTVASLDRSDLSDETAPRPDTDRLRAAPEGSDLSAPPSGKTAEIAPAARALARARAAASSPAEPDFRLTFRRVVVELEGAPVLTGLPVEDATREIRMLPRVIEFHERASGTVLAAVHGPRSPATDPPGPDVTVNFLVDRLDESALHQDPRAPDWIHKIWRQVGK